MLRRARSVVIAPRAQRACVRQYCAARELASSVVTSASHGNLWITMMQKVREPKRFLPAGMDFEVELHDTGSKRDPIWRCLTFTTQ